MFEIRFRDVLPALCLRDHAAHDTHERQPSPSFLHGSSPRKRAPCSQM
jgi:hypothetical protein